MRLALIHQSPNAAPSPPGAILWRTCLRDVLFVDDPRSHDDESRGMVADGEAYALLVEIVSGMRSPLIGETEVQAQFKAFLAALDARRHAPLLRLGQRVLSDAKRIRQRHLQGFGAHSYARLALHYVPVGARVVLVGTGALATEIITTLYEGPRTAAHGQTATHKPGPQVHQWGRHQDRQFESQLLPADRQPPAFHLLSTAKDRPVDSPLPATLIVAAPAPAGAISAVIGCYGGLVNIIDLRPADERTPFEVDVPTVTLDDLFAEARRTGTTAAARLDAARRDILTLGRGYDQREELHPFGWDDVCA